MFQRWIDEFKAGTEATLRLARLKLMAETALAVALAFLGVAGFIAIEHHYGAIPACFAGAALFFGLTLVMVAVHGELSRREQARRAEAAKRASAQSFLTDPTLLATGIQLARVIGVKRLVPVVVLGGLALGLMAARTSSRSDDADPPAS